MTFAELEYDSKKRRTRREIFLEKMEGLIPWQQLEDRIEPFYAKAGRGRRPYPLGVMLRVHCVQLFYNLSDPGMEDLLYEVESVRRFAGLRLSGPLPDETTILNFRHLLETQGLGMGLFECASGLRDGSGPAHGGSRGLVQRRTLGDRSVHGAGVRSVPGGLHDHRYWIPLCRPASWRICSSLAATRPDNAGPMRPAPNRRAPCGT